MKVTKNGKELAKEKYSLEHKEIFRSDEDGLNIKCGSNCKVDCGENCKVYCGHNCDIVFSRDNCEANCWNNCKIVSFGENYNIYCGNNCRIRCVKNGFNIECGNKCIIHCCGDDNCKINCGGNCWIDCMGNCKIRASEGTEITHYYNGEYLTYKFKERKTILCKDGEFVEQ